MTSPTTERLRVWCENASEDLEKYPNTPYTEENLRRLHIGLEALKASEEADALRGHS